MGRQMNMRVVLVVYRFAIIVVISNLCILFFFFQAEDGIRDLTVTGVQTCALPISTARFGGRAAARLEAPALRRRRPGAPLRAAEVNAAGADRSANQASRSARRPFLQLSLVNSKRARVRYSGSIPVERMVPMRRLPLTLAAALATALLPALAAHAPAGASPTPAWSTSSTAPPRG